MMGSRISNLILYPNAILAALLLDGAIAAPALAGWGPAWSSGPGDVDFPLAINCCAIDACAGSTPPPSYCAEGIAPVINSCDLVRPQAEDPVSGGAFSCLDFAPSSGGQNVCWTDFQNGPSVDVSELRDLIQRNETVVPRPLVGERYALDTGSKSPALRALMRQFEGFPGWINPDPLSDPSPDEDPVPPEAQDVYPPFDGKIDQGYKLLPVFDCASGTDDCTAGQDRTLVGYACIEIREIEVPDDHNPDPLNDGAKLLRVKFVCPSTPTGSQPPFPAYIINPEFEQNCGGSFQEP